MARATQTEAFWRDEFSITDDEELALQDYFLEAAKPRSVEEVSRFLVQRHTAADQPAGPVGQYQPNEKYEAGQLLVFPTLDGQTGEVVGVREGNNPRHGNFDVIEVALKGEDSPRSFVAGLENFRIRGASDALSPLLSSEEIFANYGQYVVETVQYLFEDSDDYVEYHNMWLPRGMLIEFHEGYLNIAEAMIDMVAGSLTTDELLTEMEVSGEASPVLKQFSLNYALETDPRFTNNGTVDAPVWSLVR